ncbi:DUF459 domain-containing protein [Solidesulfovibrio magneticus]|uniref:LysM domain-containing protein n=1 Tax=Solidesulfovibrio magneticus (strain ATCC 700980 / DSM 13731 / RS-1) TaxID=573370 RepID=C4XUC7_SOLM1|nr:DUF459 domain-containing protein [Solidesulfovibrio magneticus]BAH76149.1 hypothetical protein DMR_26580 [Solidesulfovibrio magneticus RS-1]
MPNPTAKDAGPEPRHRTPARQPRAADRREHAARAAPGPTRRFLAALACLACLLGTACGQDEAPKSADAPKTAASSQPPAKTATLPQSSQTPQLSPSSQTRAKRLLVVGDSLSISLGEQLEHALAGAPGLDFSRDGQRSTGLSRPELLDWPARLRELVAKSPPDIVVIMIGANDVMPLTAADGNRVYFDQPAWAETYTAKARELLAICRQANPDVAINWVGAPSMGDAALAVGVKRVNAVLAKLCAEAGCRFIDAEAAFSDADGRYTRHARDAATGETTAIRTADGVHLTEAGARLLAGVTAASLTGKEQLPPAAGLDELRAQARDLRPVADPAPQAQREASGKTKTKARPSGKVYSVRDGDTFRLIAKRLGVSEEDLVALNPDADPRRLSIGQSLRLPVRRR